MVAYNVFVDHPTTGDNIDYFARESAYEASALANIFVDSGYQVDTDLWSDTVPDAMVSPAVWSACRLERYPALLMTPSECYALHSASLNQPKG